MKLNYSRPINQAIRDLQTREHDWRPIPCRLVVQGCVPGLSFDMRVQAARELPEPDLWPRVTGSVDAMLNAKVDPRFVLSEIVRCRLDPSLFGRVMEKFPRLGRSILVLLLVHRRNRPEVEHLDAYIAAGRQARARGVAHQALKEMEFEWSNTNGS